MKTMKPLCQHNTTKIKRLITDQVFHLGRKPSLSCGTLGGS